MSASSVPRCGRLDEHEAHEWIRPALIANWLWGSPFAPKTFQCPGVVVIEGGHQCSDCQRVMTACVCAQRLADERNEEWYS